MSNILRSIVEPGLLSSGPVRTAVLVGTVVAVTSAVVGVFTVIRGQSFAGHSLADVATTGGAGALPSSRATAGPRAGPRTSTAATLPR